MRLLERFDHKRATAEFLDFRPTLFFGVPTMYVRLLDTPRSRRARDRAFMRLFVSGSAPLPAQVLEDFRPIRPHDPRTLRHDRNFMNISNPYVGERRAGRSACRCRASPCKSGTRRRNPARRRDRELFVRGPNVFAGYWRRAEATKAAFVDGYFRTGDIGDDRRRLLHAARAGAAT